MELSGKRRCLALWFPYLPCERVRNRYRRASLTPPEPLVLTDKVKGAWRLAAVDRQAQRLGLQAGLTLADARARVPELAAEPHEPHRDARLLERLAARLVAFTPMVAVDAPDGLLLDITGCAHLFGGEAALIAKAAQATGLTTRHACASNGAAARALARYGAGMTDEAAAIRRLPVAALELDAAAATALRRAGLACIGDLASRPMATLAARFGEAVVMRLRQMLGEVDAPLVPLHVLPPLRFERRFAEPIARTDYALDVLEELLHAAAAELEQRKAGGRRFAATLCRSDGAQRLLTVETSLPVRDPAVVMRLLRERIETLGDPIDPGFGFDSISLLVAQTDPLAARQLDTENAAGALQPQDDVAALLDQLSVRLGRDNVLRLVPLDSHIPEMAQCGMPVVQGAPPAGWSKTEQRTGPDALPRPLFLFDPPQPIEAIAEVPDGPPHRFSWQGRLHDVRLHEGPERIAAEWWRRESGHLPGHGGLTRDYYRIEDSDGRRYWIFRHGLYSETGNPGWFIHGLFP